MARVFNKFFEPGSLRDDDLSLVLVETLAANPTKGFVPAYRFAMHLPHSPQAAGEVSLRLGDSEFLTNFAGQVAFRVAEPFRGQHLAARACRLILPLARRHGLDPLWITCNPDNLASRRSCEIAGATYVECVEIPPDCDLYAFGERQKMRYRL